MVRPWNASIRVAGDADRPRAVCYNLREIVQGIAEIRAGLAGSRGILVHVWRQGRFARRQAALAIRLVADLADRFAYDPANRQTAVVTVAEDLLDQMDFESAEWERRAVTVGSSANAAAAGVLEKMNAANPYHP